MPKIKSHSGAAKRFKKTGSGKFKTLSVALASYFDQEID